MKEKSIKRAVALVLAGLILFGTVGYFFSMIAYGAETISGDDVKATVIGATPVIPEGTTTIEVQFRTTNQTLQKNLEAGDTEVVLKGISFEWKDNSTNLSKPTGANGTYTVSLTNIKYTGKGKQLSFAVKNDSIGEFLTVTTKEIDALQETPNDPGTEDPGTDDDPGTGDPSKPALPSNMTYTIEKIYRSSNGENVTYIPGDSSRNDPSIHRGYYVDAMVRFSIPGVTKADIIANSIPNVQVLVDRGGFRFQSATDSAIKIERVEETSSGVICHVSLKALYYTGSGNTLAFTVQSKNNDETAAYIYEQFTAEVSSCVPYTPSSDDDGDDDPDYSKMQMATPYVIVSNYSYGGTVTAGDTFTLSLTFYNTSRNIDVTNMMITVTMPEALMLTSSSNTFYVDQLDTESSVTETMQVTAKANAAPQSHNIDVSMKYQYIDDHLVSRRDNSTQETISIPIIQVDRFQVTGVDVSQEIYLNEESYLTVNFVNKGRSDVYNLSAEISGDIQNPGQQQNLGNLSSGATGSADFYITPNAEGVCTGEVKITYEDTNMEEKTATILWSTNVTDPMAGMDFGPGMDMPGMMEDPGLMDGEEQKSSVPFIIGGVAVAAAVAGLLIRRRILKKRSEEADANL